VSWLLYGWASESFFPVGAVNGLGAVMAIIFWFYFVKYEKHNPKKYIMLIAAIVIVMLGLTLYVTLGTQKKSTRADIIGYISCVGSVLLFGSPLMTMRRVIMTKNSQIISIGLAGPGAVNGFLWSLYGILESDNFVLTPNCIACCLCIIQVILIFVYPRSKIVDVDSPGSNEKKLIEEA
jgi:solute carrier family 50 protein (sugar transporter)